MSFYSPWFDNFYELSIPRVQPRTQEQYYGMVLTPEEVMATASAPRELLRDMLLLRGYNRPWQTGNRKDLRSEGASSVTHDKDKLQISLNVAQFAPDEITVKTINQQVVVEAKHEERQDERGSVFRHFVRKFNLPRNHKPEDVVSTLSSDGVLTITAPRRPAEVDAAQERVVPIQATDPPSEKKTELPADQTIAATPEE